MAEIISLERAASFIVALVLATCVEPLDWMHVSNGSSGRLGKHERARERERESETIKGRQPIRRVYLVAC